MRSLALPAIALLGVGVTACGGASRSTYSVPQAAIRVPTFERIRGYVRGDSDVDGDAYNHDDDYRIRDYGDEASAADERAVTALVKRYYAAAAAGDGAEACALTFSSLAKKSNLAEAVPEEYAPVPGTPSLRGKSCAQVMSLLSKQYRQELVADAATLEVTSVRVNDNHGFALLGFRTMPERQIPVERERGVWRIDGLLDGGLP